MTMCKDGVEIAREEYEDSTWYTISREEITEEEAEYYL